MSDQDMPAAAIPEDCKLFGYGVSIRTAKEELAAEFEKFGEVLDAYNSGKGYAFITYGNKSEAENAKEAMNGQTICGQEIKVDVAKPRGSARPRGPGRGGGEGRGRGGFRGGRGRGQAQGLSSSSWTWTWWRRGKRPWRIQGRLWRTSRRVQRPRTWSRRV